MADHFSERFAELDPTLEDPPPAPGTPRFQLIKEKAMQTTTRELDTAAPRAAAPPARRRGVMQVAAAAVALLIGGGVLMNGIGTAPAAAAVVGEAAENLGAVETFRAELVQTYPDGEVWTFLGEFDGTDSRQVAEARGPGGDTTSTWEIVVIDDTAWMVADGAVTQDTLAPEEQLAPFGDASAAVIAAALEADDVEEVGVEQVRGEDAVRYQVGLDDRSRAALAALAPGQLSWFEMEDAAAVRTLDIWVAEDLVRRIEVTFAGGHHLTTSSAEFHDIGADVVITPPR